MNSEQDKLDLFFDVVWDRICKLTGWRNYGQLADFLQIKPASVSGAKKRGYISLEWVYKVAQGYGASTDWLATGKGPMKLQPDIVCEHGVQYGVEINEKLLGAIIASVEEYLATMGRLTPEKKGQLISTLYAMFLKEEHKVDKGTVLKLVKLAV